jgi:hypothetical protein
MAEKFEQGNSVSNEEIKEVKAVIVSSDQSKTEVTEEDFAHFIGKKADKYLSKFRKFNVGGVDKFAVTWHWPAFFFGLFWMLYRKLYLWALLAFILDIIISSLPYYFAPLIMIVWGMTGNYIYYKHVKKKILKLKTDQSSFDLSLMAASLRKIGGVNRWVPYTPVIIIIAGICVAIAIPQFSAYRMRAYNTAAQADLINACTAQEAHFVDNATYCDSIERLTGAYYGLYLSEGVTVYVQSASKDHYLMVAFHEKGNRKYVITGPGGEISEAEKTFSIADFNKAIEINPSDADAYYNRGVVYHGEGQYDQAISDYTKAIEIDPRYANAYNNRGLAYGKGKEQYDKAISDFSKAVEINPRHAEAYNNRGFTYYIKGQHDKAISDYSKALEINPTDGMAYVNRIVAYIEKKEYEKAWDDVNNV